jgi:hypothetical protein
MVPMPFRPVGIHQRIGCRAPLSGGRLSRQDEPGHSCGVKFFEPGRQVLASSPLWIRRLSHVVVEIPNSDGQLMMPLPPDREQVGDRLPTH